MLRMQDLPFRQWSAAAHLTRMTLHSWLRSFAGVVACWQCCQESSNTLIFTEPNSASRACLCMQEEMQTFRFPFTFCKDQNTI